MLLSKKRVYIDESLDNKISCCEIERKNIKTLENYGIQKIITCSVRAAVSHYTCDKVPQKMYQRRNRKQAEEEIIRLIEEHEGHVISIETVCDHARILAELSPKYAVANEITTLTAVTARIILDL